MPITFAPDYKSHRTPEPHRLQHDFAVDELKAAVAKLLAERPLTGDGSVWVSKELRAELKAALEAVTKEGA